ncbi:MULTISPECIES: SMC-Scp complex subunit ScpB [unclassified Arthrobacter]|uniref:SMC-Scp complex subunit ScpB n=1 Tax=unclassified Arthrobacter TaxID=235627 RepID=UPI001E565D0F|nr:MULTISPECIES: SMC-Scp complex subunit ScpB [unclassified Arthrobacter]MCC9144994.1 SMC-Scp complex subunit ScpB [Arthrobacter sp. zg-Y919]MDK1276222.1 SMC-Scp complex subunit ScpB [Arthrobacter sp. zg.Y919]WIB02167.1 SMC-Scp complex subunit ScpB [Arthrobacter sp. zg-Y919]
MTAEPVVGTDQSGGDGAVDAASLPGGVKAAVEAVLMVVDEPAAPALLASVIGVPETEVLAALTELQQEYDGYTGGGPEGAPRGFELRDVAGGWRIFSRADYAPVVSKFVLEGQSARLSQAALETLAVIAYRQPVSRARVSAIRGVNVDSVVRTLVQRGLIVDAGTEPETGSLLYRTTPYFLERLGLGSLDELPQIAPHLPGLENLAEFEDTTY